MDVSSPLSPLSAATGVTNLRSNRTSSVGKRGGGSSSSFRPGATTTTTLPADSRENRENQALNRHIPAVPSIDITKAAPRPQRAATLSDQQASVAKEADRSILEWGLGTIREAYRDLDETIEIGEALKDLNNFLAQEVDAAQGGRDGLYPEDVAASVDRRRADRRSGYVAAPPNLPPLKQKRPRSRNRRKDKQGGGGGGRSGGSGSGLGSGSSFEEPIPIDSMSSEEFVAEKHRRWRERKRELMELGLIESSSSADRSQSGKAAASDGDGDGDGEGGVTTAEAAAAASGLASSVGKLLHKMMWKNGMIVQRPRRFSEQDNDQSDNGNDTRTENSSIDDESWTDLSSRSGQSSADGVLGRSGKRGVHGQDPEHGRHPSVIGRTTGIRDRDNFNAIEEEGDEDVEVGDRQLVQIFVKKITNDGFPLIWHKVQDSDGSLEPALVKAFVLLGGEFSDGSGTGCLQWAAEDIIEGDVPSIARICLFDIKSVDKVATTTPHDPHSYPFAIPQNNLCVTLNNGGIVMFEAKDEGDQKSFIHGIRWLIARLAFNLIVGNRKVCNKLLNYQGAAEAQGGPVGEDDRNVIMDSVNNRLVERFVKSTQRAIAAASNAAEQPSAKPTRRTQLV